MKTKHRLINLILFAVLIAFGGGCSVPQNQPLPAESLSPAEARVIAEQAYVYGFPLVDSYRVQYAYFVDTNNPEYKGPWNEIHNSARLFTPEDKAIQTPNSDTVYSMLGAELRAEPLVITVPEVETNRYYSAQFIDLYTFNFAYVGSRTTGNGAGSYLLAGPNWKGKKPPGIKEVIHCETEFALVIFRTQLFGPDDIDNVKKVQAGYEAQPLSSFLGHRARRPAHPVEFMKPLTAQDERISPEFFNELNFLLQFCPTHPSEKELMARFAKLGVGAGENFDADKLLPEMQEAIEEGMADAWKTFDEFKETQIDTGEKSSADSFGTREYLKNDYLSRMAGAVLGIYGNSKEEALYPAYFTDADGEKLDGAHQYTLHFAAGELPPVNAFWSVTMYELPDSLLYANPLNRYLINSLMLPDLKKDDDGGLTLYIQHDSPGAEKESNWLPTPAGPFFCVMRLYWPKPEASSGEWKAPPLEKVN
jgi:hypothetical protein